MGELQAPSASLSVPAPFDQKNREETWARHAHGHSLLINRRAPDLASFPCGSQRGKNLKGYFNQLPPAAVGPNMSYSFLEQSYFLVTDFANYQLRIPASWGWCQPFSPARLAPFPAPRSVLPQLEHRNLWALFKGTLPQGPSVTNSSRPPLAHEWPFQDTPGK